MRQLNSESDATESSKAINRRSMLKKAAGVLGIGGIIAAFGTGTAEAESDANISVRGGYGEGWSQYTIKVNSSVDENSAKNSTITNDESGNTLIKGRIYEGDEDYYISADDDVQITMMKVNGTVEINKETPDEYYLNTVITFEGDGFYHLTTGAGKFRCRNAYSNEETEEIDEWSAQCTAGPIARYTNNPAPIRPEIKEDSTGWDKHNSWCTGHIGDGSDESDRYRLTGNIERALLAGDMTVHLAP